MSEQIIPLTFFPHEAVGLNLRIGKYTITLQFSLKNGGVIGKEVSRGKGVYPSLQYASFETKEMEVLQFLKEQVGTEAVLFSRKSLLGEVNQISLRSSIRDFSEEVVMFPKARTSNLKELRFASMNKRIDAKFLDCLTDVPYPGVEVVMEGFLYDPFEIQVGRKFYVEKELATLHKFMGSRQCDRCLGHFSSEGMKLAAFGRGVEMSLDFPPIKVEEDSPSVLFALPAHFIALWSTVGKKFAHCSIEEQGCESFLVLRSQDGEFISSKITIVNNERGEGEGIPFPVSMFEAKLRRHSLNSVLRDATRSAPSYSHEGYSLELPLLRLEGKEGGNISASPVQAEDLTLLAKNAKSIGKSPCNWHIVLPVEQMTALAAFSDRWENREVVHFALSTVGAVSVATFALTESLVLTVHAVHTSCDKGFNFSFDEGAVVLTRERAIHQAQGNLVSALNKQKPVVTLTYTQSMEVAEAISKKMIEPDSSESGKKAAKLMNAPFPAEKVLAQCCLRLNSALTEYEGADFASFF